MKTCIKLILPMLLLWHIGLAGFCQEPLPHPKKIYIAPDGKIFVQKGLPLYLRLSTSPDDNVPSYMLRSEHSSLYTNPFYLDTEGVNTIRSPWAVDTASKKTVYPKQEIIFEVYADSRPPVTAIAFNQKKVLSKKGKLYIPGKVEITLSAKDEVSGVEHILYSLNGESYKEYTGTVRLSDEKEYQLKYYAVDHVGNAESVHSLIIVNDKTGPKVNFSLAGDTSLNVLSGHSSIRLLATDAAAGVAGIYYRIDSSNARLYETPLLTERISQGEHVLSFFAMDDLGNCSDTLLYPFYVDKTPPMIVQEFIGKSFIANGKEFASGKMLIKLTSFDNKSGVKAVCYSVNGGPYEVYHKPFYPPDQTGDLKMTFYAIDNVGNKSEVMGGQTAASAIPCMDISGPELRYDFTGPVYHIGDTLYVSAATRIRLKAFDDESGVNRIEYRIDEDHYQTYTKPFSIQKEGKHTIHFVGYDQVDNTNQNFFVAIFDNTGPDINITFGTSSRGTEELSGTQIPKYPVNTKVFIAAADAMSGVEKIVYNLNNTGEHISNGMIQNLSNKGIYKLAIRALDRLGNISKKEITFIISDLK